MVGDNIMERFFNSSFIVTKLFFRILRLHVIKEKLLKSFSCCYKAQYKSNLNHCLGIIAPLYYFTIEHYSSINSHAGNLMITCFISKCEICLTKGN